MKRRLIAAAVTIAAAFAVPAAASAAPQPAPQPSVTAHGLRADTQVHLPPTHLPKPSHIQAGTYSSHVKAGSYYSQDWAGYADVGCSTCSIRYVTADFNVPSVNPSGCVTGSGGTAYDSTWVGLDGFNDTTVEQIGTTGYCSSSGVGYYAWYEMYPLAPVTYTGVEPGDAMNASVYWNTSTNQYQLVLNDLTTGGGITTTQPCGASHCGSSSAEVITEDPGGATAAGFDLAPFGMTNFTNITVTSRGGLHGNFTNSSLWQADELTMQGSASPYNIMATPSTAWAGAAFNIAYNNPA